MIATCKTCNNKYDLDYTDYCHTCVLNITSDSPYIILFYKKYKNPKNPDKKPFVMYYPSNPLDMYNYTTTRPSKASLVEPDGWIPLMAYRRWLNKIKEQLD